MCKNEKIILRIFAEIFYGMKYKKILASFYTRKEEPGMVF